MPALIQSDSTMQESESPWQNSLGILPNHLPQSSLGKRQRDHGDDGRLTGTGSPQAFQGGMMGQENVGQGMNGFGFPGGLQESGPDLRMGMKRLKSNTDRPSFTSTSYPTTPFSANPPPLLRTTGSFASSSTTSNMTPPTPMHNPFFPNPTHTLSANQAGSSSFSEQYRQSQLPPTLLFGSGHGGTNQGVCMGNSSDYVLATQGLRLESPHPPGFDSGFDSTHSQAHLDMDMDNAIQANMQLYTDLPSAPPPSMFSVSSISSFQPQFPEAGPSMPMHTPQRPNNAHHINLTNQARNAASVSPHDANAEPYWQDGLRGIVRPGGLDGSPLADQHRGSGDGRAGGTSPGSGPRSRNVKHGMDLGRSVAMAMGMGMDSTMTHGDIEMDESPVFTSLRLPAPSPVPPTFSPDLTTHRPVPTTPGTNHFEISPAAPVNTPATTPTRQHAMPHLQMTGCQSKSRYTMGPRADCEKCVNRVEGHVAHWK